MQSSDLVRVRVQQAVAVFFSALQAVAADHSPSSFVLGDHWTEMSQLTSMTDGLSHRSIEVVDYRQTSA